MMYQDIYNCICQNTKNEDMLSSMSNLQPNWCLKIDFQKVDQLVSKQGFSYMASCWLDAAQPANQKPGLKTLYGNILVLRIGQHAQLKNIQYDTLPNIVMWDPLYVV